MKKRNYLGLGLAIIALSSCQVKVGEVETSSQTATIEGTWSTDCIANSSDSYIKTFSVENGTMTMATLNYTGTRLCDQANLASTVIQSGLLTNTGDNASITNGKNFEWKMSSVTLTPYSAAFADMLNAGNVCGSSSWAINQPGFLFGCNAGVDFDLSQVSFNTIHYGVFTIESSATPNYLQFGAECGLSGYQGICPSTSDRSTSLDGTVYFRR